MPRNCDTLVAAHAAASPDKGRRDVAEAFVSADQCRIGRAAIGWTEQDLAAEARLPAGDIVDLENGTPVTAATSSKVLAAFAAAGVSFFQGPDGSSRMRARTLDGIIEAPVTMAPRT
jgi:hypothetical protein